MYHHLIDLSKLFIHQVKIR